MSSPEVEGWVCQCGRFHTKSEEMGFPERLASGAALPTTTAPEIVGYVAYDRHQNFVGLCRTKEDAEAALDEIVKFGVGFIYPVGVILESGAALPPSPNSPT
jgi:hypothetical protein